VARERWATEKVIAHYDSYIEKLATVKEKQPDGSVKTYVDEDMKQSINLKLLEEISNFPMETNG
ncbi:MAG: helix-turn-helix domain-containing protein, partial [Bacillota bacterium]|nr:helix-turn-helix domain-containing protein [Bacillota bacterium]